MRAEPLFIDVGDTVAIEILFRVDHAIRIGIIIIRIGTGMELEQVDQAIAVEIGTGNQAADHVGGGRYAEHVLVPVGNAIVIRIENTHHWGIVHRRHVIVFTIRATRCQEEHVIGCETNTIRPRFGIAVHIRDRPLPEVIGQVHRVAAILDIPAAVIKAVHGHECLLRSLDLVHLRGDQTAILGDLPDPQFIDQRIGEGPCAGTAVDRGVHIEQTQVFIAALEHGPGSRQQAIDVDTHRFIVRAVNERHMRPDARRDRVAHGLVGRSPVTEDLHKRAVGIQPHDKRHPAHPRTVRGNRTGLVGRAGLQPGFDRPAIIGGQPHVRSLDISRRQDRASRRIHGSSRHGDGRHKPPGIRILHSRRRHRLRAEFDILLTVAALEHQHAHRRLRIATVAEVVHPDLIFTGNHIRLFECDILGAGSRNVINIQLTPRNRLARLVRWADYQVRARCEAHIATLRIDQPGIQIARHVPLLRHADVGPWEGTVHGDGIAANATLGIDGINGDHVFTAIDDHGVREVLHVTVVGNIAIVDIEQHAIDRRPERRNGSRHIGKAHGDVGTIGRRGNVNRRARQDHLFNP